ncbi:haloacid dehalogenase type II [Streptomyces rugosispiralis]|uniref:Haloacid dehalogenase type II n=1 Tax=Streptomyces rugosispiralis TaxID=2967341 RepID=A0ABT1VC74_9ACTN|nr:haloacid dehalogenase type II [Streptomyces rugosispiralis]MCQ8194370.1 haloacid dehalogenase type II [Streptomyces rugosispiralis]
MSPLAAHLEAIGLPGHLLPVWFAGVLRDGIALSLAGGRATFVEVGGDVLRTLRARHGPGGADPAAAVDHVLSGLPDLPVQPDVPEGVRALHAAGHRPVTLTNGSADTTRAVLDRATGVADLARSLGPARPADPRDGVAGAADGVPVAVLDSSRSALRRSAKAGRPVCSGPSAAPRPSTGG